jgi:hypothetical protein
MVDLLTAVFVNPILESVVSTLAAMVPAAAGLRSGVRNEKKGSEKASGLRPI